MSKQDNLTKLLRPRSIGFIGASSKPGFQIGGASALAHLLQHGYDGDILLISRSASEIAGRRTYPTADALPYAPDCSVVSTPAEHVEKAVGELLARGARSFVLLSTGFSERSAEGRVRESRLRQLLDAHEAVALGPNTTGFTNFFDRIALSTTSRLQGALPPKGSIGLVLQSGALGSAFLEYATDARIGLSYVISIGNAMNTGMADYIDALVADERTKVILLYVEGFADAAAFAQAAVRARDAGKPIVLLKVGRTAVGERAAVGHTGAMTGSARIHGAVFRQLGIVQADGIGEALTIAQILSEGRRIGRRIGVSTPSGGLGGLLCDALSSVAPFEFPSPSEDTAEKLAKNLPAGQAASNPLDVAATPFARPGGLGEVMQELVSDPSFDSVLLASTPVVGSWAQEIVQGVIQAHQITQKFVGVAWETGTFNHESVEQLRRAGVPVFANTKECTAALALIERWEASTSTWRPRTEDTGVCAHDLPAQAILDEAQSKDLLRPYLGASLPSSTTVTEPNFDKLRSAAEEIGYPVVLKALVEGVAHKSDIGLVTLDIDGEAALGRAFASQSRAAETSGRLRGFYVAEQVSCKAELLIGVTRDPEFGLVMTFGAGGIFAEIAADTSIRVLPASRDDFREMIEECKVAAILHGARGGPELDIEAVIDVMVGLSEAARTMGPRLNGIEINPLGVMAHGLGVKALDAKIFLAPEAVE